MELRCAACHKWIEDGEMVIVTIRWMEGQKRQALVCKKCKRERLESGRQFESKMAVGERRQA